MNKELIKTYKAEFDHWLNGGEVLFFYWGDWFSSTDNPKTVFNHINPDDVKCYVINDKFIEIRKALAEGRTIQYNFGNYGINRKDFPDSWKDLDPSIGILADRTCPENYRVKPEEPKFKVGDWVVYTGGGYCDGEILQITKIDEKGFCTFGSYNKLYHFNKLRRWKPKPDEWCWVCDDKTQIPYLRKFVCINIATNTPAAYSYKVEYESDIVSYNYIEPFIGILPSTIEQY